MKKKLALKNIIGYSSINFLGSGYQGLISAWLMYFYTTLCGISPVQAGAIFSVARLIDGAGNPILGFISDNFGKTALGRRFGRRKFFILVAIPILAVTMPLMWTAGHTFNFYFIVNLIYEIAYTMIFVPGTTLPAEMTQDAADKAKLVGGKQYCGTLSSIVAAFIPAQLFMMYGKNSPTAFLYTGVSFGALTILALIVFYLFTYERDPKEIIYVDSADSVLEVFKKLGIDISSSMRNKSFRHHCVMQCFGSIFKQLTAGVFTYFAVFVLLTSTVTVANINGYSAIVSSIALFVFIILAYRIGAPKTFRIGTIIVFISLAGYLALAIMGTTSNTVILLTIFALINMIGKTGIDYVPTYQTQFMADIDEAITGQRREGIYTGVNSLLTKIAAAVEAALLGFVLSAVGFQKGLAEQPHSAIVGINVLAIATPVVLLGIACISTFILKLNKETHKILVDEVNRLKAGGSMANATPEAKKAFKDLTGWDYEKCWGNNNVGYSNKHVGYKTKNAL
ncbi:MFS transporter [Clostridium beijerinckii]|uniref:Putative symporter YjmB n=1 Tax=Clostridium beijerinckii TaxID=1520 RepID=A0A1S8SAU5_CLOBE|nr:MFS transporter [Clostridium beijerinckii]NRY59490.1 oligogalacturonide transporter [Clostridium beijerinckii]OOM62355.1 putative symporter YjmB [Clostridium beijerinckii]